jgi:hypothetical protein
MGFYVLFSGLGFIQYSCGCPSILRDVYHSYYFREHDHVQGNAYLVLSWTRYTKPFPISWRQDLKLSHDFFCMTLFAATLHYHSEMQKYFCCCCLKLECLSCPTIWARKFNVHYLSKLCPYLFSLKRNAVSIFLFNKLQYFVKGLWYWLEFHSKSSIPTQKFSSDLRMQQGYHMTVAALLYCRTGTLRMQHR